jgi:hypothetical protein
MIRLTLTPDECAAVRALRRDATLTPAERDRVEMVSLSAAGWSPPRIAAHLAYNPATVRRALKQFERTGPTSLRRRPPGPPPDAARRERVEAALGGLLDQDRTWTAAQLAAALGDAGIRLSVRQTRKYLSRMAAWRRTVQTLRHKQDERKVERAKAVLGSLKKKPPPAASASSISTSAASPPANR